MNKCTIRISSTVFFLIAGFASTSALACATCGCSLSTDAAMGYSSAAGWRLSLQYDYINQNQLRSGTSSISSAQVAAINDAGGNQEVERSTINRYTTVGLSYMPNARLEFQPAAALHRPQPQHLWRSDQPAYPGPDKRGDRLQPGRHQVHRQLAGTAAHAQPRLPARRKAAYRRLWRTQRRRHRHRRSQSRRIHHSGPTRKIPRRAISSTPACRPAPAAPTSSSVRTTTRRSARISMPSSMGNTRRR